MKRKRRIERKSHKSKFFLEKSLCAAWDNESSLCIDTHAKLNHRLPFTSVIIIHFLAVNLRWDEKIKNKIPECRAEDYLLKNIQSFKYQEEFSTSDVTVVTQFKNRFMSNFHRVNELNWVEECKRWLRNWERAELAGWHL